MSSPSSSFSSPRLSSLSPAAQNLAAQMPHALWRANQTAVYRTAALPSGFAELDKALPQGGWPAAAMIELLVQQAGIGEMRLLRPVLQAIGKKRRIALVQPPHLPQIAAWSEWGLPPEHLLWIKAGSTADALWSAEQVLRNGSCGAMLFWQTQARAESLRRLHLAAQDTDMLFWMVRPLAAAQDASPSPLRLGLRPAQHGIAIDFIKRRGAMRDSRLYLPLRDKPVAADFSISDSLVSDHALLDRPASSPAGARSLPAALV